jgi:hypothetical protein
VTAVCSIVVVVVVVVSKSKSRGGFVQSQSFTERMEVAGDCFVEEKHLFISIEGLDPIQTLEVAHTVYSKIYPVVESVSLLTTPPPLYAGSVDPSDLTDHRILNLLKYADCYHYQKIIQEERKKSRLVIGYNYMINGDQHGFRTKVRPDVLLLLGGDVYNRHSELYQLRRFAAWSGVTVHPILIPIPDEDHDMDDITQCIVSKVLVCVYTELERRALLMKAENEEDEV